MKWYFGFCVILLTPFHLNASSLLSASQAALKTDPAFRACMASLTNGAWEYDSEGKAIIQAHGLWGANYIPFDVIGGVIRPHQGSKMTTTKDHQGREVVTIDFQHPDPVLSHYLGRPGAERNPFTRPLRNASVTLVRNNGRIVSMALDRNVSMDDRTRLGQALDQADQSSLPESARATAKRIGALSSPSLPRYLHTKSRFYFGQGPDGECVPDRRYDDFTSLSRAEEDPDMSVVAWDIKVCQSVFDHHQRCPDISLCPRMPEQLTSQIKGALDGSGAMNLPVWLRREAVQTGSVGPLIPGHGNFSASPISPYLDVLLKADRIGAIEASYRLLDACNDAGLAGALRRGLGRDRGPNNRPVPRPSDGGSQSR